MRATALLSLLLSLGCTNDLGLFWDPPPAPDQFLTVDAMSIAPTVDGATLTWFPVNDPRVTGYRVYDGTGTMLAEVDTATTTYTVTGAAECTTVTLNVRTVFVAKGVTAEAIARHSALSAQTPGNTFSCVPTFEEATASVQFGAAVLAIDDVDGDNRSDAVIGSPNQSRAVLYTTNGSPTLTQADLWFGTTTFGSALAAGADLAVGGTPPFTVIGAPGASVNDGLVEIVDRFGGTQASLIGIAVGRLGESVAVGDVDGDGAADDVVMGEPDAGMIHVGYSGAIGTPTAVGTATGTFGTTVATGGDTNGDAAYDVAVGAPTQGGIGDVVLYLGSADISDVLTSPSVTVSGTVAGEEFGATLAMANVNGDLSTGATPLTDVIVGSPGHTTDTGLVSVFFTAEGAAPSLTPGPTLAGENVNDRFGESISAVGDVNGDGYDDFLVGAPGFLPDGRVYFVLGDPTTLTVAATIDGTDPGALFGSSISGIGDFNSDGELDVLSGGPGVGSAYIHTRRGAGTPAAPSFAPIAPITGTVNSPVTLDLDPTVPAGTATIEIEWGDGAIDTVQYTGTPESPSHTYFGGVPDYVILVRIDDGYQQEVLALTVVEFDGLTVP